MFLAPSTYHLAYFTILIQLFSLHISHFSILTIESFNMAVLRICHNIPWLLIPSHNCSQKSHFLLEQLHAQQIGKHSQLNLKLLLQDMVGFVSRMPLIAKLVRNFIDIPRVMTVIELTCIVTLQRSGWEMYQALIRVIVTK